MLNVNVSNPKSLEAAIRSVSKFADIRQHNTLLTERIMVQTLDRGLRLTATDLYTSVEFAVNSSDVISDGEFCIKAASLKKIGEIVKDDSAVFLEQTEKGLELSLFDVPTFGATFEVSETDEFPMTAKPDPMAHWIELNAEHVQTLKKLAKYADTKERGRVGYDAIQFAMPEATDTLYAYTTDGTSVAYAKLGRTRIPNFAIPVEAIKKALQVANTSELKNSEWRVTLPSEDSDVISIQIADTAVKFRAGDSVDLTDWILKHHNFQGETDDAIAFEPKALLNGLKKVSKLFIREAKFENILIIEGKMGNITMTAKVVKKRGYATYPKEAADMQAEYLHEFSFPEAECLTGVNSFRILVDGKRFESMVRDLAVSKPDAIRVQMKCAVADSEDKPSQDTIVVSGTDLPLGFITMPAKL